MLDAETFWAKVARGDGCWEWSATRNGAGYGLFTVDGKQARAHRVSYELANGPIPTGLNVRHTCDNPPCVRPDHLLVGTQKQNIGDSVARHRHFSPFKGQVQIGSANRATKLSEDDVRAIRAARARGERLHVIGARHGITESNVSYIARGRTWTHVH